MRNKDNLKLVLFYLTLLLISIKFVLLPAREQFETEKSIYQEYLQIYNQKSFLVSQTAQKKKNPSEEIPSVVYFQDKDPLELQLYLGEKIRNLAQRKRIDLMHLEFPSSTSEKDLTEIPISLQFKAKAKDAISFLKALELEHKEIYYKEVTIQPEGPNLNVTLTLVVFKSEI